MFSFDSSTFFLILYFTFSADPCYCHQNLSDASRKSSYVTPDFQEVCDDELLEGWYRFAGAAGKKMPTTHVPRQRCGTVHSGWLNGAHPTVEDGKVRRKVCFSDRYAGCKYSKEIFVKKLWILLHLQTFSTCLFLTLLWNSLNVRQKIQPIRGLIN